MTQRLVTESNLTAIADEIRSKGGTSEALTFPQGFIDAIEAIQTGGGLDFYGAKLIWDFDTVIDQPSTDGSTVYTLEVDDLTLAKGVDVAGGTREDVYGVFAESDYLVLVVTAKDVTGTADYTLYRCITTGISNGSYTSSLSNSNIVSNGTWKAFKYTGNQGILSGTVSVSSYDKTTKVATCYVKYQYRGAGDGQNSPMILAGTYNIKLYNLTKAGEA